MSDGEAFYDILGIDMRESSLKHLGSIPEPLCVRLSTMCVQAVSSRLIYNDGWDQSIEDGAYHPSGNHAPKMVTKWQSASELTQDASVLSALRALVPKPDGFDEINIDFLLTNYIGCHHDRMANRGLLDGTVVLVLSAPKGCRLLGGEAMVDASPGSVFMLNDQELHGAFPVASQILDYAAIDECPSLLGRFVSEECMSFLLVNRNQCFDEDDA